MVKKCTGMVRNVFHEEQMFEIKGKQEASHTKTGGQTFELEANTKAKAQKQGAAYFCRNHKMALWHWNKFKAGNNKR